jgi:hypothetical protein
MPPEPTTNRQVRLGFLLGLGCVMALVLGALAFFGRPSASVAKAGDAPKSAGVRTFRTKTGYPVRSSAKLALEEAGNVLPDAPELGERALAELAESCLRDLQAIAKELGCADETRLFGLSKAAEDALGGMQREPGWRELDEEMHALQARWDKADPDERLRIHARVNENFDVILAEVRRRWSTLPR